MNSPITSENCFESPEFCAWWDEVEGITYACADDGWQLEMLVELYNDGTSVKEAADKLMEDIDIARAEAYDAIPPWDR